jgi:hypothetical protein
MLQFGKQDILVFPDVKFGCEHVGWLLDVSSSLFHASNILGSSNFHV